MVFMGMNGILWWPNGGIDGMFKVIYFMVINRDLSNKTGDMNRN